MHEIAQQCGRQLAIEDAGGSSIKATTGRPPQSYPKSLKRPSDRQLRSDPPRGLVFAAWGLTAIVVTAPLGRFENLLVDLIAKMPQQFLHIDAAHYRFAPGPIQ